MKKIDKLREVNKSLSEIVIDLEARIFVENNGIKKHKKKPLLQKSS